MILLLVCFCLVLNTAEAGQRTGSLAFVANIDGNWDIFTVDENGKNLVRLTRTPYDENEPRWSADRKRLIYSTANGRLHIIDVDTKEDSLLEIGDKDDKYINASFSPDGRKIVCVHCKAKTADDTKLAVFDFDTKAVRTLIDQYTPQYYPVWSPDGARVAFINVLCSAECGRIIQELWLVEADGPGARQITLTNSLCMQPVWSPDGKKIAFSSDKNGNFDIWIFSFEDGSLKQLTSGPEPDTDPAWSPDGSKVAFVSMQAGKMRILLKELNTGKIKTLIPFSDKDIECREVAW